MSKRIFWNKSLQQYLLPGDYLLILLASIMVFSLFNYFWHSEQASKLRIRSGDHIYATYSLDQNRNIEIHGLLGISRVQIDNGRVRFEHSPCSNQYCVHQGWLKQAGEVAVCLPNRISLELLGKQKNYDSLNY